MARTVSQCALIAVTFLWLVICVTKPDVLSDKNTFILNFVNNQLLSFLGVVVTITLASAANLHLELNKKEEKINKRVFTQTRLRVRQSAHWLIGLLTAALIIAIVKPLVCHGIVLEAVFNGAALIIVFANISILIDLTQTAFALEPSID